MSGRLADRDGSWPVVSSEDLHRDGWVVALRADWIRTPVALGGDAAEEPFRRVVLEHPGAVVVMAVDDDEQVLCLEQYRHPVGRTLVELPAGLCDVAGEEPLAVARRELREEAELEAQHWEPLLTTYSSPGISAELVHTFLARGLTPSDRAGFTPHHEEAAMTTRWVPFAELLDAVRERRVADAHLVQAALAYDALHRDR